MENYIRSIYDQKSLKNYANYQVSTCGSVYASRPRLIGPKSTTFHYISLAIQIAAISSLKGSSLQNVDLSTVISHKGILW